jgi:hypothetical protein
MKMKMIKKNPTKSYNDNNITILTDVILIWYGQKMVDGVRSNWASIFIEDF